MHPTTDSASCQLRYGFEPERESVESITLNLHFLLVRRVFKCILRVCAYLFAQLLGVGSRKTTCVHGRLIGNPNYINSKK